jgi:phosphatidylglycerophosphatase A
MTAKTDPSESEPAHSRHSVTSSSGAFSTGGGPAEQTKPRLAIFIATSAGLGYFPKAPGTLGSLAGLAVAVAPFWLLLLTSASYLSATHQGNGTLFRVVRSKPLDVILITQVALTLLVAGVGVWSANRAAKFWHTKDPQRVVIDEVSGMHLTLLLGCGVPIWWKATVLPLDWASTTVGLISIQSPLDWKYLLLGFILFRLFDIWKPTPARQAESLPGGWGIMADDWIAGTYAAIGLWLARAAGL